MNFEQKLAVAQQCKVEFPCQGDCAQDFTVACPSMWREVDASVCEAPVTYSGNCAKLLDTSDMSEKDKYTFGIQCGARWPCLDASKVSGTSSCSAKDYKAACPAGWFADGVHCKAPATYKGCSPCQRFDDMSPAEKQDWEQLCHASFPCVALSSEKPQQAKTVSFLSARTIPVDAYKIRNSLFDTAGRLLNIESALSV